MADVADTELLDYEEEEQTAGADAAATGDAATANGTNGAGAKDGAKKDAVKGTYVSIHSSGFRDFLLKPEILRAIVDCGFEHPSEGECRYVLTRFKEFEPGNGTLLKLGLFLGCCTSDVRPH